MVLYTYKNSICALIMLAATIYEHKYASTGMIVARVRLNKLDATAYSTCFSALFRKVKELHPEFDVGKMLQGILADWSDTQLKGLEDAIGEENVNKVMKGCQVCF